MTTPIDLALEKDDRGLFDLSISDGDFATTNGFDTALVMSLLCERRADPSEVSASNLRRGWWGNELSDDGFEIGSKLWLIDQSRRTQDTMNLALDFSDDGLSWFVDDGHLKNVGVQGSFTANGILLKLKLNRDNSITDSVSFELWERTDAV